MTASALLDWKLAVALGLAVSGIILSLKMSPEAAERVSIHAIDACKEVLASVYRGQ